MVPLATIQAYANEIARKFHPNRIVLFGSHAAGTAGTDSDVDLLVVIAHDGDATAKAIEIRRAIPRSFSLALIVRDPQTLQWRIANNDWFLRDILANGRVLYEAADVRVA